jgi:hypothetical protein
MSGITFSSSLHISMLKKLLVIQVLAGLPKEGVFVKVHVWSGVMDYYADLEEVCL